MAADLVGSGIDVNLLLPGSTADYIDTGAWAEKAIKEAKRVGAVAVAATTAGDKYARLPTQSELQLTSEAFELEAT